MIKEEIRVIEMHNCNFKYRSNIRGYLIGEFKKAGHFKDGFACVQLENGNFVMVDTDIKTRTAEYEKMTNCGQGLYAGQTKEGWTIRRVIGNEVLFSCEDVHPLGFREGYLPVKMINGPWRYINKDGQAQVGLGTFQKADVFRNGYAAVTLENGREVYINTKGKNVGGELIDFNEVSDYASVIEEYGVEVLRQVPVELWEGSKEQILKVVRELACKKVEGAKITTDGEFEALKEETKNFCELAKEITQEKTLEAKLHKQKEDIKDFINNFDF